MTNSEAEWIKNDQEKMKENEEMEDHGITK